MKRISPILVIVALLFLWGCDKPVRNTPPKPKTPKSPTSVSNSNSKNKNSNANTKEVKPPVRIGIINTQVVTDSSDYSSTSKLMWDIGQLLLKVEDAKSAADAKDDLKTMTPSLVAKLKRLQKDGISVPQKKSLRALCLLVHLQVLRIEENPDLIDPLETYTSTMAGFLEEAELWDDDGIAQFQKLRKPRTGVTIKRQPEVIYATILQGFEEIASYAAGNVDAGAASGTAFRYRQIAGHIQAIERDRIAYSRQERAVLHRNNAQRITAIRKELQKYMPRYLSDSKIGQHVLPPLTQLEPLLHEMFSDIQKSKKPS